MRRAVDDQPSDHGAEVGGATFLDDDVGENAILLGLVDDCGLVGFDLHKRLAAPDRVAWLLQPAENRRLLHRVRQLRHRDVNLSHR